MDPYQHIDYRHDALLSHPRARRADPDPPPHYRPRTAGSPAPGYAELPPPLPLRPARSATNLKAAHAAPDIPPGTDHGRLPVDFILDENHHHPGGLAPPRPNFDLRRAKSSSALSSSISHHGPSTAKEASKWKAALGEAQYFAGGLISKATESTRHYSIIRHSTALIWHRGPSTSVAITVLSDEPLPDNRTIWLQQKGYSGNVGMSLKALVGTTGSWTDVTPETRATAEHLPEMDERGYQRDLRRFMKKAAGRTRKHLPRQTLIVRIPAASSDGYFRVVLCCGDDGKKVLCGSPVFRIASTSTDAAVVKGASIRTMPLEVGVKVGSFVGRQVAHKYTGVIGAAVHTSTSKVVPVNKIIRAGKMTQQGLQTSGLQDHMTRSWNNGKVVDYEPLMRETMLNDEGCVGPEEGPMQPFPLKFEGRVARGTGQSLREYGIPTANLRETPEAIKMRMVGVFVAWAMILPGPGLDEISEEWFEAIVTIAPPREKAPDVVMKNKVLAHILKDLDDTVFYDARVKVLLMGFLHAPLADPTHEQALEQHNEDALATLGSLAREAWRPQGTLARMKTLQSARSFSDRMDTATGKVHEQLRRVPLHLAGIRSESGALKDQAYGIGGLWTEQGGKLVMYIWNYYKIDNITFGIYEREPMGVILTLLPTENLK